MNDGRLHEASRLRELSLSKVNASPQHLGFQRSMGTVRQVPGGFLDYLEPSLGECQVSQSQPRRAKLRLFFDCCPPLGFSLSDSAFGYVEHGQVVTRFVAAKAGIHAGEMVAFAPREQR